MKGSLRRTLALRFAATMAIGLLVATGAFYWAASRALQQSLSPAVLRSDLLLVLLSIVVAGTAATLMGAWHFTSSAVRPVAEITAQATRIEAGTLDQRILAHADTEEYEGLVAVLNRMLERLERGFAAQRRLTADVSHELRTPLTALRGEIEVALRAPRSQREYEHVLRSGLEEIDRLTELSEDLLLVTRAEARLVSAQRVATDIERLVDEHLERLRRQFEERGLAVDRSLRAGHPAVLVDPDLIGRLVDHLLDNALQFTPVGGRIAVQLEPIPAGGGLRLAVENSGPGIAAVDLPHLFEPFYRSDPSRTRTADGGTGLGLALVASIAQLHGGLARASSVPGRNTRFEVDIPAPPAN
ncbi:MAG TPA: ATP-binding protein [Gemmatimonadales bacterium]|nr:ATP-binding protein [Gemmatimonadales bacterium]